MLESVLAFNLQSFLQAAALLAAVFIGFGSMRNEVKSQALHLNRLDHKIDKLENAFIQLARQEERLSAMDQRMLAQGKRLDRLTYGRKIREEDVIVD